MSIPALALACCCAAALHYRTIVVSNAMHELARDSLGGKLINSQHSAPSTATEPRVAEVASITVVVKSLSQCGRNSSVGTSAATGCACSAVSTCIKQRSSAGRGPVQRMLDVRH